MAKEMDLSVQELKSIVNIDRKQIQYWLRKGTQTAKLDTINF